MNNSKKVIALHCKACGSIVKIYRRPGRRYRICWCRTCQRVLSVHERHYGVYGDTS